MFAGPKRQWVRRLLFVAAASAFLVALWFVLANHDRVYVYAGKSPARSALPTIAVATDVSTGEPIAFSRGDAATANRTSTAVPGTFKRVRFEGREYFDGEITAPVPVRIAHGMGARTVIAVNVVCHSSEMLEVMRDYPDLILSDYYRHALQLRELPRADLVISPRPGYYAGFSHDERIRFVAVGEQGAQAALPALQQLLNRETR